MTENEIRDLQDRLDLAKAQLGSVTIMLGRIAVILEDLREALAHERPG